MTKKEFDRLYSLFRLYIALSDSYSDQMGEAAWRLVHQKQTDCFNEIMKAGGFNLKSKFHKMDDGWHHAYERYAGGKWIIRAYQRKNGNSINQKDWDNIERMRGKIQDWKYRVRAREWGDIPY